MKKAIIIGASSGIGFEVARQLLAEGWQIGVAARREERLMTLKAEAPDRVEVMTIDITKADAEERLMRLIERLGGMNLYFHASGIGKQNRTLEPDIELRTVETNALGFTRMIGAAYRYFADSLSSPTGGGQEGATIAAISSIAGTKGLGPAPSYSATKALQATYLEALEQQAHQRGLDIHITDIRPGFVDTALLNDNFPYPMLMRPETVARDIVRSIHKHRHVRIIDWRYRILTALWGLIPRWLWRHILITAMALAMLPCIVQAQQLDAEPVSDEMVLDTVEALSEDTTFFYEGEDTTEVIVSDSDFDDMIEEWTSDNGFLPHWLRGLFGGGLGILGVVLVLVVTLFVLILLLLIFTAPIWALLLIIWLLMRKSGKKERISTQDSKPRKTQEPPQQPTDNYNKSEN